MKIDLLPWDASMARDIMNLFNHIDRTYLTNRLPNPYTQKDVDWFLGMLQEHEGKDGLWRAVTVDGKICGEVSIEQKCDVYSRDCEIGYTLLDEYKGQGIMTEAAKQMCKLAFEKLDIIRITGLADAPNLASRRVMEKCGFQLEGVMKKAVCKDGEIWDLVFYGKLKENAI